MLVFIHLSMFQIQKFWWCRSVTNLTPLVTFCESFWWYGPIFLIITGLTAAIFIYLLPTMFKFINYLSLSKYWVTFSLRYAQLPSQWGSNNILNCQSVVVKAQMSKNLIPQIGNSAEDPRNICASNPCDLLGLISILNRKKWFWGCQTVLVSCGF